MNAPTEHVRDRSLLRRMLGAARLDIAVYEEVEMDREATSQAAFVVGIVAVCAAIGAAPAGVGSIVANLIAEVLAWLIWAGLTYLIGDKLLGGTASWGELLRTLGFAQSPGVLLIFAALPVVGGLAQLIVAVWLLVAGVLAIRQALDFGTGRAIGTAVLGWLVYIVFYILIGALTTP